MKIKIGCVGLGTIACCVHLPQIKECGDFELTAICDIDKERLASVGDEYGIDPSRRYTDYHELIACKDIEAVDICTPNDCHFEIAMEAAQAGKAISLEKPVTLNAEEAKLLADTVIKAGVANMICFSYRYKAAARYARALVRKGEIGNIHHVDFQYFQGWGLEQERVPLVWRFQKSRSGSGALGDLGSHGLDLVRFVTGKEYKSVVSLGKTIVKERELMDGSGNMGSVDVDDYCNYMAEMEEDIAANFLITRLAYGRGNYQRMELYGSKGAIVYKLDEVPGVDELEICIRDESGEKIYKSVSIPEEYKKTQMQDFADIVNKKSDGLAAGIADGLINQTVIDKIIQSQEKKVWIEL
ncbi:Gfo/Idh/MocA family protein [Anaerocolumna xylanovorans]|uniref:Predicted dehydrogenase n=1 Tax=Anaerocolumna xylanovorans DSM 12503 TaxID=1121345 RepID=A0A1M7Y4X4_9FIRM|nr:Gfo/Idh/MocA family oxidoreductase [Anaerocolumna xylanovorans]SHO47356.1 Predicted dehydrogenase [Anaerocolumna xylanovorans DSM 12503]